MKAANKGEKMGYEKVYEINGEDVKMNVEANGYRLPTEAEWEYAAREEDYIYAGSNNLSEVAWGYFDEDDKNRTLPKRNETSRSKSMTMGCRYEWKCFGNGVDWYGNYDAQKNVDPQGVYPFVPRLPG